MGTKTDALGNLIVAAPTEKRPSVLLFHESEHEVRRWAGALADRCDLHFTRELDELDRVLEAEHVDVVVTGGADAVLERLGQRKDLNIVHCSPNVQEAWLEAAERGLEFAHVDDERQLAEKIFQLTFPRSFMARHLVRELEVGWRGVEKRFRLIDISNDGFSFRVDADHALDSMLPGAVLEGVEMHGLRGVALTGAAAVVRHVQLAPNDAPYYWVGCELRQPKSAPAERITIIEDRTLVASLLRSALRLGGIVVGSVDSGDAEVQCAKGELETQRGEIVLEDLGGFSAQEVLRGRFSLGGSVYRFFTSVIRSAPLVLRVPLRLEALHQRGSTRFHPPVGRPVQVDLYSVLAGASALRMVRDLSSTGFSLDVDPLTDVCPPGTVFHRVTLRIAGQEFTCRGLVKNLTRIAGTKEARCGVVFQDMDEPTRVRLSDQIVSSRYPGLVDGCRFSFDQLWQFFLDTRFVYPEKQANMAPLLPEIRRTIEAANGRPTPLFKSTIAVDEGTIVGHISSLRVYDRSWMSQHLAASAGRHAGSLLNFGQLEVFDQNPDLEYFKCFFRPENKWPARMFGTFAKTVKDARLSDLRSYAYFVVPLTVAVEAPTDIEVVEAAEDELAIVERYFVGRERGLLLSSDNLTRRALTLAELNAAYKKIGLQRRRRVLIAWRKGVPLGFALAEVSSPGLNFSELLSAFQLVVLKQGESAAAQVRRALLGSVLSIYRQAGRPAAIGLCPIEDRVGWEEVGLSTHKVYTMWTCHRALVQRFVDHVDRMVRAMSRRTKTAEGQVTV